MNYPDISLFELIHKTAKKMPTAPAYSYFDKCKTYRDFIGDINHCGKALRAIGIGEGDTVTICMPNTPEAITAFYGINQVGAIANMLHPLSSENEILEHVRTSNSKAIFILDMVWNKVEKEFQKNPKLQSIVLSVGDSMPMHIAFGYYITKGRKITKPRYGNHIMNWKCFIERSILFKGRVNAHLKGDAPAVILYSGGTTGIPKGILLSNLNFNSVAMQSFEAAVTIEEGYSFFSVMPIFHGFGLGVCFHTAFYTGGKAIILPSFNSNDFGKLLMKYKPNVLAGVPTLYEALITKISDKNLDLSFIKFVVSGGDTLSPKLKREVDSFLKARNCNIEIREGYGLTECTTACCLMPYGTYKEGSIGKPYSDVRFKIVEPNTQNELRIREEGEIILYGPMMMLGYLNDEEETNKQIKQHDDGIRWLHTGDFGSIDEEGFVYFKQRIKRLIVTSGYNIYPQNIENVIQNHPAVFSCAAIGVDHPYKKQVAKAFVVLNDNVKDSEESIKRSIMELCRKNLTKFSLPAAIEFRKELPKTLIGKVAYQTLVEQETNQLGGE